MEPIVQFLMPRLDRRQPSPLYLQLREALLEMIQGDRFPAGSRLPPTRTLARQLGLNRTTVCAAYNSLESAGWVASHVGRGTLVVRNAVSGPVRPIGGSPEPVGGIGYSEAVSNLLDGAPERSWESPEPVLEDGDIDFSRLLPDERLFPVRKFRTVVNQILEREGSALLQYGPASGYAPMREVLARRMVQRGLPADPENLLIVSGAQQGMDLVFRMFLDPGSRVVVESPTYSHVLPLLRFHRATILGIPMTTEGMDLDALERTLTSSRVRMIYTMPGLHNPTGITTGPEHRERLLSIAARHGVPILEDGFEEEIRSSGKRVVPLKALDRENQVIHLGTFSKGLFPGLRIGWLLANSEIIRVASEIKSCSDYHTSLLSQAALAEFCRQGHYDAHLERMHRVFRRRLRVALKGMQEKFPEEIRWNPPAGGSCIWLELPAGLSSETLRMQALQEGVRVAPGMPFFDGSGGNRNFRISISRVNEEEIRRGIARLGKTLGEMLKGRQEPSGPVVHRETIPYF
ncbi:MAG: PLP-dependent aminotransferase family protein [Acidobacteriota bacterium]